MFCPFFFLLMLCGCVGVLAWLGWRKISDHLRRTPGAAELLAKHIIAPLLVGREETDESEVKPEVKQPNGTLMQEGR